MDTFDAIYARRAIRHFDPSHQMSEEDIKTLMNAAMQSPTSFNMQNWRFVLVRDPELLTQIKAAAWDQAQVTESSLLIILTADVKAWAKDPQRYFKNAPEPFRSTIVGMIGPFYESREVVQRDEAMRSVGIAGQTIMLAAKAMGLDSCPMVGFDPIKVAELIRLPEDHVISYMIAVGKAKDPAGEKAGWLSYDEVVIENRFS